MSKNRLDMNLPFLAYLLIPAMSGFGLSAVVSNLLDLLYDGHMLLLTQEMLMIDLAAVTLRRKEQCSRSSSQQMLELYITSECHAQQILASVASWLNSVSIIGTPKRSVVLFCIPKTDETLSWPCIVVNSPDSFASISNAGLDLVASTMFISGSGPGLRYHRRPCSWDRTLEEPVLIRLRVAHPCRCSACTTLSFTT